MVFMKHNVVISIIIATVVIVMTILTAVIVITRKMGKHKQRQMEHINKDTLA